MTLTTKHGSNDTDRLRRRLVHLLPDAPAGFTDDAEPEIVAHLAAARAAFVDGYRRGLRASRKRLSILLADEPAERRGFALEGAGMAAVLLDAFGDGSRGHLEALLTGRSTAEQTLIAIGAGWAGARLLRPLDRLPTGLPPDFAESAADGYGFHQGYFHPDRFTERGFPAAQSELHVSYDVGLGRALWFVHTGREEPIACAISAMSPKRRASLWRGVGTACAFTRCAMRSASRTIAAAGPHEISVQTGLTMGMRMLDSLAQTTDEHSINKEEVI